MNNGTLAFIQGIILGLGATFTLDLWVLFLNRVFKITPSNICLIGRWLLYMPEGTFKHSNITSVLQKQSECTIGWIAHYLIGILFALAFLSFAGSPWLQRPTLLPAIIFGILTVLAPFLIMQPSFGFGVAASKTANPSQAQFRSLMNHAVFGIGLYLFGWLVRGLLLLIG